MSAKDIKELVDACVDELFRNGFGENADRLVLMQGGHDLGGWSKLPVRDRLITLVTKVLETEP